MMNSSYNGGTLSTYEQILSETPAIHNLAEFDAVLEAAYLLEAKGLEDIIMDISMSSHGAISGQKVSKLATLLAKHDLKSAVQLKDAASGDEKIAISQAINKWKEYKPEDITSHFRGTTPTTAYNGPINAQTTTTKDIASTIRDAQNFENNGGIVDRQTWISRVFSHLNEYRTAYITGAIVAAVAATGYLIWRHMKKKTLDKVMNDPKLTDMQKIKYIQDSIRDGKARLAKAKNDKDKKAAEDSIREHEEALRKLQGQNSTKQESFTNDDFSFLLNS